MNKPYTHLLTSVPRTTSSPSSPIPPGRLLPSYYFDQIQRLPLSSSTLHLLNMDHSHQHKSARASIEKVFGYRRRSMSSHNKSGSRHYVPPPPPPPAAPVEHKRVPSNTGSGSVSTSSSRSSMNLEPTAPVAEWCHQMHMIQNRKYDWCNACHPKTIATPTIMPSERLMQQRRMSHEPTHAYQ